MKPEVANEGNIVLFPLGSRIFLEKSNQNTANTTRFSKIALSFARSSINSLVSREIARRVTQDWKKRILTEVLVFSGLTIAEEIVIMEARSLRAKGEKVFRGF